MVAVDACCCAEESGSGSSFSGSTSSGPQLVECGVTCAGAGFNAPRWWDITISGLVDEECDDCDTYNSTFRVEHNPFFSVNRCAWTLMIPEGCAICRPVFPEPNPRGANFVFLELFGATDPTVWVHICHMQEGATGGDLLCNPSYWEINFREVFSEKPNCLEMNNYLIDDDAPSQSRCPNYYTPPFGLVDACDANSGGGIAECRITAVTQP